MPRHKLTRKEHIELLAAEMGVMIHPEPVERYQEGLDRVDWIVYLWDWEQDEDEVYWVALHELGHAATLGRLEGEEFLHVLAGLSSGRSGEYGTPGYTEDEAQAWAWALDNAAFPLQQAGESSMAWGISDYASHHGWEPSESFARLYDALGDDPDWFHNVTTEEHWQKLETWARPTWAEIAAHYRGGS